MDKSDDLDIDYCLSQIDTEDLVAEVENRGYSVRYTQDSNTGARVAREWRERISAQDEAMVLIKQRFEENRYHAREVLFDLLGLNYNTSKEDLLKELESRL